MVSSFKICLSRPRVFSFWAMGLGCKVCTIEFVFLRNTQAGWGKKFINLKMRHSVVGAVTDSSVQCLKNPEEEGRTSSDYLAAGTLLSYTSGCILLKAFGCTFKCLPCINMFWDFLYYLSVS